MSYEEINEIAHNPTGLYRVVMSVADKRHNIPRQIGQILESEISKNMNQQDQILSQKISHKVENLLVFWEEEDIIYDL